MNAPKLNPPAVLRYHPSAAERAIMVAVPEDALLIPDVVKLRRGEIRAEFWASGQCFRSAVIDEGGDWWSALGYAPMRT